MDWTTICRGHDGHIRFTHFKDDDTMANITPEELERLAKKPGGHFVGWTAEQLFQERCANGIRLTEELLGRP